ncbi:MAG: ABC transporter permease [Gemmatimonadota bacterium]|nr:ABC transporter permease [Gemmatimonadota bacterium]
MSAPRWASALIRRLAPRGRADDVIGDLEEVHRQRIDARGRIAASVLTWFDALDIARVLISERIRVGRGWQAPGPDGRGAPLTRRDRPKRRLAGVSALDAKLGLRMLVRHPGLTLVGGIGMVVAVAIGSGSFALLYSGFFPTIPLDEGDRLVGVQSFDLERNREERRSLRDFHDWRTSVRTIEDLSAFTTVGRNLSVPGAATGAVAMAQMTASGFRVARVAPLLGRTLVDSDDQPGAPPVLVIGHEAWQTRFGGDPDVVGRQVRVGDEISAVIGVMPEGFTFPVSHHYWIPFRTVPTDYERGEGPAINVFGRLAPSVTVEEAQAELTELGRRVSSEFPETHEHLRPEVLPYAYPLSEIRREDLREAATLQLMVSLLLVIVAVNVGVLAYARTAMRSGEITVRTALGASRRRIVAQLFVEAFVLCGGAAAIGLFLGNVGMRWGSEMIALEMIGRPFWWSLGISPATVLYVLVLTALASVIVGVVPALKATGGGGANPALSRATEGLRLGRTWTALIVAQVAFAVGGLPAAVSVGLEQVEEGRTEPTFAAEELVVWRLALDDTRPAGADLATWREESDDRYRALQQEMMRRLRAEPEVTDITSALRYPGTEPVQTIEVDGVPAAERAERRVRSGQVDTGFFDALDVPVLAGRVFDEADVTDEARPVVVNRRFVETILGGANALGQRVRYVEMGPSGGIDEKLPPRWHQISGVVADLHVNDLRPEWVLPTMYHPIAPGRTEGDALIAARVRGGASSDLVERFHAIARTLDPALRLADLSTLAAVERQAQLALRIVGIVTVLVLVSVLLLSAAGIYALMSFAVTRRLKEIGIRTALGASRARILRSVFARAAAQLGVGLTIGIAVALGLNRISGGALLQRAGGFVVPSVAIILLVVGVLASIGPARRGLRVQPMEVLREE